MRFLKKNQIDILLIYILPILFGFSTVTFLLSIIFVALHFGSKNQMYLFFLILIIYKYASKNLIQVDKSFLNPATTLFSLYYCFKFFKNFKYLINNSGIMPFLLMGLFAIASSYSSVIPSLSAAKSFGFLISGIGVYYVVFFYFKEVVFFLTNIFALLVLSSFIIPKDIGIYNSSLGLYSGILNQSQAFGWVMTLCLPFFLVRSCIHKFDFFHTVILFGGLFFLFNTHMRSAYIAVGALFLALLFFDDLLKKYRFWLFFSLILFFGVFFVSGRSEFIQQIFDKRGSEVEGVNGVDEMISSRSKRATPSLANFYSNPFLGIGYGLPTESTDKHYNYKDHWGIVYFPGTDLVISFPVEKGVLYTAILEELGLIGFILFLNLIFRTIRILEHRILLIIPVLILSIGEASLFSLNGIGLFGFVVLSICTVKKTFDWHWLLNTN
jgi:hypothetical protein